MGDGGVHLRLLCLWFLLGLSHGCTLSICEGGKRHTVASGDTCGSISTKYKLGWDVLYALNPGLDCQGGKVALKAGLELCVGTGAGFAFSTGARLSRAGPLENGFEYYFAGPELMAFDDANDLCAEMGGALATVHSGEENEALFKHATSDFFDAMSKTGAINVSAWLGIKVSFQGDLSNVDGTVIDYSNWSEKEPNTYDDSIKGACTRFGDSDDGEWRDSECDIKRYPLCKRKVGTCGKAVTPRPKPSPPSAPTPKASPSPSSSPSPQRAPPPVGSGAGKENNANTAPSPPAAGGGSSNTLVIGAVAGAVGALVLVAAIAAGITAFRRSRANDQKLPEHMAGAGGAAGMPMGGPVALMPAAGSGGNMYFQPPAGPSPYGGQYPPSAPDSFYSNTGSAGSVPAPPLHVRV